MAMWERAERAWRHVLEGRRIVARQRKIVTGLDALAMDASHERHTLRLFEGALAIFEQDLLNILRLLDLTEPSACGPDVAPDTPTPKDREPPHHHGDPRAVQ